MIVVFPRHEYGSYFGSLGVLLVVAGFFWILTERPWT
jgi:hypothetical protein